MAATDIVAEWPANSTFAGDTCAAPIHSNTLRRSLRERYSWYESGPATPSPFCSNIETTRATDPRGESGLVKPRANPSTEILLPMPSPIVSKRANNNPGVRTNPRAEYRSSLMIRENNILYWAIGKPLARTVFSSRLSQTVSAIRSISHQPRSDADTLR